MPTRTCVPFTPGAAPEEEARSAGLRYAIDDRPGISRVPIEGGFRYIRPDGSEVDDEDVLQRIDSLRIPPAWEHVWISQSSNSHLQATGRDARGRKQHIYHPRWRETRDRSKFHRMLAFGHALPVIREAVDKDLAKPGLSRDRVLAAVVRLLESTLIRVGNDEYARENDSYGLTTLRDEHVEVEGSRVLFAFRGKRGKFRSIGLRDRRLANIVRKCQELPGQELFQYVDENGDVRDIGSSDVNDYLKCITGQDFSAKDFRTWAGTVLAAVALGQCEPFSSEAKAKRAISSIIKQVAEELGNTPAICRKSYVHPLVLEAYRDGSLGRAFAAAVEQGTEDESEGIQSAEQAVMRLLEEDRLVEGQRR